MSASRERERGKKSACREREYREIREGVRIEKERLEKERVEKECE